MVKQVIVMRSDLRNKDGLKVRTGKLIAQGAHASLAWLVTKVQRILVDSEQTVMPWPSAYFTPEQRLWMDGNFKKVVLKVDSEDELRAVHEAARDAGLTSALIVDDGLTEFGGVKTLTACAIGPDLDEKINAITGHLKPL